MCFSWVQSILLTVCLWVYFELWIRLLLLSFFTNYLFVFDSWAWLTWDSVKLLLMSWFTFTSLCVCVCVCVHFHAWLDVCVCVWGGGGAGASEVRLQCSVKLSTYELIHLYFYCTVYLCVCVCVCVCVFFKLCPVNHDYYLCANKGGWGGGGRIHQIPKA